MKFISDCILIKFLNAFITSAIYTSLLLKLEYVIAVKKKAVGPLNPVE